MTNIRTDNDFFLGASPSGIRPMLPVSITTQQQAFRTAAWILAMAPVLSNEDPPSTFDEIQTAIRNT